MTEYQWRVYQFLLSRPGGAYAFQVMQAAGLGALACNSVLRALERRGLVETFPVPDMWPGHMWRAC